MTTMTVTTDWREISADRLGPRIRLDVDHGLVDGKGRRIGGFASVYTELSNVGIQATRNGRAFGASFPKFTTCPSIDEAKAAALAKLAAQGARYHRLAAPRCGCEANAQEADPAKYACPCGAHCKHNACVAEASRRDP